MNINLAGVHTIHVADGDICNIHRIGEGCRYVVVKQRCTLCGNLGKWHVGFSCVRCQKHVEELILAIALSGHHMDYMRE